MGVVEYPECYDAERKASVPQDHVQCGVSNEPAADAVAYELHNLSTNQCMI